MNKYILSDLKLAEKEAAIWYLGHSGWAVKTKSHFLIFDYSEAFQKNPAKKLANGYINPDEIKDENVFVFASHDHYDHYDKIIHEWEDKVSKIKYILGWDSKEGSNVHYFSNHKEAIVEGVKISTLTSTDAGVGFLVKVDGISIFHAGDHANWEDEPTALYQDEIDFIAQKDKNIDIAFLPVTTFTGVRQKDITQGAFYAIEKLKPKYIFPMHGNGREYLYKEFADDAKSKGVDLNVNCAENVGDSWQINIEKNLEDKMHGTHN